MARSRTFLWASASACWARARRSCDVSFGAVLSACGCVVMLTWSYLRFSRSPAWWVIIRAPAGRWVVRGRAHAEQDEAGAGKSGPEGHRAATRSALVVPRLVPPEGVVPEQPS